jgi:hypothetical protein
MGRRGVHNERFKAWVYAVINPVLEGLRIESAFLQKKDWTFRVRTGELEYVRPVAAYVEFPSQPNLEDFLESNQEERRIIAGRDQSREALREKCQEALAHLAGQEGFRQKVSSCADQFTGAGEFRTEVANMPKGEFHKLVAQLIVNNIRSLPEHYSISRFWSQFGEDLMAFRIGEVFQQADQAGEQLVESNKQVSASLRETRKQLAEEHDVPFAPYSESLAR